MGKAVKSIEFCYTSCSPTDSSLLWLVLVFLGIHSFQNRQVWGRIALCRRLRYGFSSAKRPDTGLIPFCCSFPSKKRRSCASLAFALLFICLFWGDLYPLTELCAWVLIFEKHTATSLHAVELVIWLTRSPSSPSFGVPWLHYTSLPSLPGTSNHMANGPRISRAFYVASARHMASIWSGVKRRRASDPREADGRCGHLGVLRHGWHQLRSTLWRVWERDQPITASVHIIFSFAADGDLSLGFFFTWNFLLVSNFSWKLALQEKLPSFSCLWHWHNKLA